VVASGSSVTNTLLPVPEQYNRSKRSLREFYHEKFSPASDVDLFLYGLTEEQAVEKIKDIETRVRDALLTETTVVRTKHAITICEPLLRCLEVLGPLANTLVQAASTRPVTFRYPRHSPVLLYSSES
jgi:hypothetical protein